MDDDDALVGGSDEDRDSVPAREEEEEEEDDDDDDDEEAEPDGMVEGEEGAEATGEVEDLTVKLSECTVEYNRQHAAVPEPNKVRDHKRYHYVPSPEKLGEMKASSTTASRWPMANQIDPASIVVLQGRIKEDDPNVHFVWYMRVVVEEREDDSDDKNALLHIPRGVCKDLLTLMAKDEQLCESSLITTYMPTNYNEQRILPKLNGWDPISKAPNTIAVKPKAAGAGGKTKADERDTTDNTVDNEVAPASAPAPAPAKKAKAPPAKALPSKAPPAKPKAPPAASAKPPAKKPTATGLPAGKSSVQANVSGSKPGSKPGNPFEKAKATAPKEKATAPKEKATTPTADDTSLERVPTYDPAAVDEVADKKAGLAECIPSTSTAVLTTKGLHQRGCPLKMYEVTHTYRFDVAGEIALDFKPPEGATRGEATVVYKFA